MKMDSEKLTQETKTNWIHFWLFGPEFGCVKRQFPIIKKLIPEHSVLLLVHPNHLQLLQNYFKNERIAILAYPCGINLEYDSHLNLNLRKSITNLVKFCLYQWLQEFLFFKRNLDRYPAALIVTDFLPYIPLWAKFFQIPTIGVYNYGLSYASLGSGFFPKILGALVLRIFRFAYQLPDKMFIESILPRPLSPAICVPIIRRFSKNGSSHPQKDHYFIALGGKSDPGEILAFFEKVHRFAPHLQFCLIPRKGAEAFPQNGLFKILPTTDPFSTIHTLANVEGIITKAGFSTVAEALQLKKKLFIIELAHHPEIKETEQVLVKLGLAKTISLSSSPQKVAELLTSPFPKSIAVQFGGENKIVEEIRKMMNSK